MTELAEHALKVTVVVRNRIIRNEYILVSTFYMESFVEESDSTTKRIVAKVLVDTLEGRHWLALVFVEGRPNHTAVFELDIRF